MKGMEWKGRRVMSASLLMRVLAVLAGIWTVFEIFDVEDMALDLNMPEAMLAAGATTIFCVAGAALAGEGRIFRLEDGRPGISLATLRALTVRHAGVIRLGLTVLTLLSAVWFTDEIYDFEDMRFDPDIPEAFFTAAFLVFFPRLLFWMRNRAPLSDARSDTEKSLLEELRRKAETDELTGLYNKSAFTEKVSSFLAEWAKDGECALFMIDMDNFKSVNDTYGHLTGDYVLAETGKTLRKLFAERKAWLGRVGGDEFMVFVCQCHRAETAGIEDELRAGLNIPIPDSSEVFTGSVGLAVYEEGDTFDSLYVRADRNLYEAKKFGGRPAEGRAFSL